MNTQGRYEFPGDRFQFRSWFKSRWHGGRAPYWRQYGIRGGVELGLCRGDRLLRVVISAEKLHAARLGWRWSIAQHLRMMRHKLREEG